MADPKFPYTTYIDRVITDENYNILFGEEPGNVNDAITHENQEKQIEKMKTQISNQQKQIDRQDTQIDKQKEQITNQETQIDKQKNMITVLNEAVGELQAIQTKQDEQTDNQESIISRFDTSITNQETLIDRLQENFDVIVNGNTMELYGNSDDDKPTNDMKIGTIFYEVDTQDVYMYSGSEWVMI